MKKRKFLVKKVALNIGVVNHDLRKEYGVSYLAEKEMQSLEEKVSPQLLGMLEQQLLAFHGDMQLEMAEDLVIFAHQHVAHTTGCPSVDLVLDVCYAWIAMEHGILKPRFRNQLNKVRV